MNYNLTPEQLKEIENRTGTSDLRRTQFNIKLADGTIIPAGINPGSAATIQLGGGVLDRSTTEGANIASQFPAQTVDPQAELNKAYAETPVVGGQQPLGQPFGQQPVQQTTQPQAPKPFGDFTYGPDQPAQTPNQDLSQQLNQMMTTLQGMQQQATGQVGEQTGQTSGYTGPSIVDYLASIGQPSDFATRQKLAQQMGIQNYTGTAEQNTQLLNAMRGQQQPVSPTQPTQPPAQAITNSADTKVQNSLQSITTGDPTKSLTDIVKELSISMGLPEITNQIQELDNKMTQEISDINLNPWLSEAERSKRTNLTQQKYEARKSALVERLKLQNDVVRQAVDYYEAEREYQKDMMKISLDEAQREISNRLDEAKLMASLSESGITDKEVAKNILNIKSSVRQDPQFKNFLEILNGYQNVEVGVSQNNAAGDLAIVNGIAKMLDPTGVVRPAEFDTVEAAQGWFEQFANIPFKVKEGRIIAPGGMERFKTLADELISTKANPIATNLRVSYSPVSQGLGVDLGVAVPELAQVEGIINRIPVNIANTPFKAPAEMETKQMIFNSAVTTTPADTNAWYSGITGTVSNLFNSLFK